MAEINSGNFVNEKVARCRGIWIPEPRAHIRLVESGILAVQLSVESRIQIVLDYVNYNGGKKVSYSDADVRYNLFLYVASQMLIKTMQRLSVPYKEI